MKLWLLTMKKKDKELLHLVHEDLARLLYHLETTPGIPDGTAPRFIGAMSSDEIVKVFEDDYVGDEFVLEDGSTLQLRPLHTDSGEWFGKEEKEDEPEEASIPVLE